MAKGEVIWELSDEPVVRSPYDSSNPVLPAFLPDPKDGSLYMIGSGMKEPLKKLPFTIPELVAASPCKSTDGILYTGKKVDTWFSVDRYTGNFPSKFWILRFHGDSQYIECYFLFQQMFLKPLLKSIFSWNVKIFKIRSNREKYFFVLFVIFPKKFLHLSFLRFLDNIACMIETDFGIDKNKLQNILGFFYPKPHFRQISSFAGSKQGSLTFDGCLKNEEDSCPNIGPSNFLVGRTEYTIMMYDSKTPGRKWNISYFDYTSNMATAETQSDYSKYFFLIYARQL